jgi:hypothetical protein
MANEEVQVSGDRAVIEGAIKLARRCTSEPRKVSPKVGAVAARDGLVIFATGSTDEPR